MTGARVAWAAAVVIGVALRSLGLGDQIPVDDEWHLLHRVVDATYAQIALSFGFVDHCIPLTLFAKLAAETLGLGELALRAPSWLAGVALLLYAPWRLRDRLSPAACATFAAALAIAPLLVLYSRFARPYAIVALLTFVALDQLARWATSRKPRHAVGYGLASGLGVWFLPPAAPFLFAPLVGLLSGPAGRGVAARIRPALLPSAVAFGVAGVLVLPPLLSDPNAITAKLGAAARPDLDTLARALRLFLGTQASLVAVALAALAALGVAPLRERLPGLAPLAGLGVAASLLSIIAAGPAYAWLGFVLARYAIPALPFVLLAIALGAARASEALPGPARPFALAGLLGLWTATGGVATTLADTRAWLPGRLVTAYEGRAPDAARLPGFYRELAERPPGSVTLIEAPWSYSLWNNVLPAYERVHRQRTRIGFTAGLCGALHWGQYPESSGIALDAFVALADPDAIRRSGAHYVVLHRDPRAELAEILDPIDARATRIPAVEDCARALLAQGLSRFYADDDIQVFALPDAPAPAG